MPLTCPNCNSRNLRYSRLRSLPERFWSWFGIRPLRCRACRTRFIERTWRIRAMKFARCPRCWRMDLSRWSTGDYYASLWTRFRLAIGGHSYRCEYCRVNFVSFRRRKERYRSPNGRTPAAVKQQALTGEAATGE